MRSIEKTQGASEAHQQYSVVRNHYGNDAKMLNAYNQAYGESKQKAWFSKNKLKSGTKASTFIAEQYRRITSFGSFFVPEESIGKHLPKEPWAINLEELWSAEDHVGIVNLAPLVRESYRGKPGLAEPESWIRVFSIIAVSLRHIDGSFDVIRDCYLTSNQVAMNALQARENQSQLNKDQRSELVTKAAMAMALSLAVDVDEYGSQWQSDNNEVAFNKLIDTKNKLVNLRDRYSPNCSVEGQCNLTLLRLASILDDESEFSSRLVGLIDGSDDKRKQQAYLLSTMSGDNDASGDFKNAREYKDFKRLENAVAKKKQHGESQIASMMHTAALGLVLFLVSLVGYHGEAVGADDLKTIGSMAWGDSISTPYGKPFIPDLHNQTTVKKLTDLVGAKSGGDYGVLNTYMKKGGDYGVL